MFPEHTDTTLSSEKDLPKLPILSFLYFSKMNKNEILFQSILSFYLYLFSSFCFFTILCFLFIPTLLKLLNSIAMSRQYGCRNKIVGEILNHIPWVSRKPGIAPTASYIANLDVLPLKTIICFHNHWQISFLVKN